MNLGAFSISLNVKNIKKSYDFLSEIGFQNHWRESRREMVDT